MSPLCLSIPLKQNHLTGPSLVYSMQGVLFLIAVSLTYTDPETGDLALNLILKQIVSNVNSRCCSELHSPAHIELSVFAG